MAAVALLGRTANGWLERKAADGRTLDALKRQTTFMGQIERPDAATAVDGFRSAGKRGSVAGLLADRGADKATGG